MITICLASHKREQKLVMRSGIVFVVTPRADPSRSNRRSVFIGRDSASLLYSCDQRSANTICSVCDSSKSHGHIADIKRSSVRTRQASCAQLWWTFVAMKDEAENNGGSPETAFQRPQQSCKSHTTAMTSE